MTRSSELDDLYDQIAEIPLGAGRLSLVNKALLLAEEAADEESVYQLRMILAESASDADDDETAVAAFSWVLEQHLADPQRFPMEVWEPDQVDLAWLFKWIVHSLLHNSAISRDQIEASMVAMEHLYTRDGLGSSAVITYQLAAAELLGDVDRVGELAEKYQRTEKDEHSDCAVCGERWLVTAELTGGNFEAAKQRTESVLKTGQACSTEPQSMLGEMLLPLLLAKENDRVIEYVNRILDKRWETVSARLSAIGQVLTITALTENVALGLELFERWVSDLAVVLYDDVARLNFFSGAAMLLERAEHQGLARRPVRDSVGVLAAQSIGQTAETVGSLAPKLWVAAQQLATAFDTGRDNSYRHDQLAELKSLREFTLSLPLGREVADSLVVAPRPGPLTAADWLHRTEELLWLHDSVGALAAAEKVLLFEGLSETERSHAAGYRARALSSCLQTSAMVGAVSELSAEEQEQIAAATQEYLAALAASGRPDRAAMLSALGLARYDLDWSPQASWLSEVLSGLRAANIATSEQAMVETYLAEALMQSGEPERAAEAALSAGSHSEGLVDDSDRVATIFATAQVLAALDHGEAQAWMERAADDPTTSSSLRANALLQLARLQGRTGAYLQAASTARESSMLFTSIDASAQAAVAATVQAAALEDAGDLAASIQATRRVLELSDRIEDYDQLPIRLELGRRLITIGQATQAIPVLDAVDTELYERDLAGTEESFGCAYWLGQAYLACDDPDAAASLWDLALDSALAVEDSARAVSFGRALGNLYLDYGMFAKAVESFEAIREAATATDDPLILVGIDERVGLATCLDSDSAGLGVLTRAKDRAAELGAEWVFADITDSLARGLFALGRNDEAIAAALSASDAFGVASDQRSKYGSLGYAAAVLTHDNRVLEAIALLEPVAEEDEALGAQLADLRLRISGSTETG